MPIDCHRTLPDVRCGPPIDHTEEETMPDRQESPSSPAPSVAAEARLEPPNGPHAQPTPRYVFAETLEEQEAQLRDNPLMRRLAESRDRLAADPFGPVYHFVSPEGLTNDPMGLCFWQGRWHFFYQAFPPDTVEPAAFRAHAVSDDLVHWRDLPYAIYTGVEKRVATGTNALAEDDRVIAFYLGWPVGEMVAISDDPLLLNWDKWEAGTGITDMGDCGIWKEGDTYYGLVRIDEPFYPESTDALPRSEAAADFYGLGIWTNWNVWTSKDLRTWELQGPLLRERTPLTGRLDEGACPNFLPIGDKHILLFFSHQNGGQYLLGDYDADSHSFRPYDHGRLNHGRVTPGGVHAPTSVADGEGGVINVLNINEGKYDDEWDHIMSLPQRLTLGADKRVRIEPVEALASLRGEHRYVGETRLPANEEIVLAGIEGNAMELELEIDPGNARSVQISVLRSADAEETTNITFYNFANNPTNRLWANPEEVVLDGSRSSTLSGAWPRPPERAIVRREGEPLRLRIFVDRSVVEVFVNGRQYLAGRVYPGRTDSIGVSLRAQTADATLRSLDAWQMTPIWPVAAE
jgi:beta-fructofuranosidase